jgi:hypothetical protein
MHNTRASSFSEKGRQDLKDHIPLGLRACTRVEKLESTITRFAPRSAAPSMAASHAVALACRVLPK